MDISSSWCCVFKVFAVLGFYATLVDRRLQPFGNSLSVPFPGIKQFKRNCRSKDIARPLNMGPIDCTETSVTSCQPTLCSAPEDGRFQSIKLILSHSTVGLI